MSAAACLAVSPPPSWTGDHSKQQYELLQKLSDTDGQCNHLTRTTRQDTIKAAAAASNHLAAGEQYQNSLGLKHTLDTNTPATKQEDHAFSIKLLPAPSSNSKHEQ